MRLRAATSTVIAPDVNAINTLSEMARHFRRAFGTSPDRTHGSRPRPLEWASVLSLEKSVGDKDNSVVAARMPASPQSKPSPARTWTGTSAAPARGKVPS
jgi:hypothetical protein